MNNQDKINILKDATAQYYNNELGLKDKLDIKTAKKLYDEYEEIVNWLEELRAKVDKEIEEWEIENKK